ncbi:siderophore-interacting protein [Streptomyces sp. NPDC020965]|uniref:siderophore-interacting protein n=1 Tax=Streptomyces sp. NPDC020965 TaxID=3365105 RepID=UPI003799D576
MSGASARSRHGEHRRSGELRVTRVRHTERITPHMARITFADDGLAGLHSNGTDQHVALYFYEPGVELPRPFTTEAARALLPVAKPRLRRYTIRHHRPELGEVDMDFVLHGADQLASGWAERAAPGDEAIWFGPGPGWSPAPEAEWTILLGDETALPAIGAILEQLPPDLPVSALIEVADRAEEQRLTTRADAQIEWLNRGRRPAGQLLHERATALSAPAGRGNVWGAAEREVVRALRRHFVEGLGVARADTHLTPYWTRGETQDSEV